MSTEVRPAHSPLGASGAERWMNCPGSVALLKELHLPESDEPDYRKEGTAVHQAIDKCLRENLDTFEILGQQFHGVTMTSELLSGVDVYLAHVRSLITPEAKVYVEFQIDYPEFHPQFYGTVDTGILTPRKLFIRDYKNGAGIVVEVEDNPQIMYYAYGLLRHCPGVVEVDLGIVQPNAFHTDGPIRTWVTTADYIREWAETTLISAMLATEMDADLQAGPWCRFCPAKLVCPLMTSLFGAAMTADPKIIVNLSDESLGRSYQMVQAVKFYLKAMEEESLRRLNTGAKIPGIKLVPKKANRVFKAEAPQIFIDKFGKEAYTTPELKTPAEMERISVEAKKLVHEFAYTPMTGVTVALESDKRPAIKVQTTTEAFPGALEAAAPAALGDSNV